MRRSFEAHRRVRPAAVLICTLLVLSVGCSDGGGGDGGIPATVDPGAGEWVPVAADRVAADCRLDPELLARADAALDRPWAVVRYGQLCHEHYPDGMDTVGEVFSATKTLAAVVTGMVAWETRDIPRSGRKTGPFQDTDRVAHWLDEFSFNPDAQVGHVLGMVAFNEDLSFGAKEHRYDAAGGREINRLSDMVNTALAQDPERLGADLEEFTQRYLFQKIGMTQSVWSGGAPDKIYAFSWHSTVRDMARLGLLIHNGGVWNGERLLSEEWVDKITHPAFEDANTSYGYLTWLSARSNYNFGGILGGDKFSAPLDPCSPAAIWNAEDYPHGLSAAPDCNYGPPWDCQQAYDVGVWSANGALGQLIVGHPGLDLVLVVKDLGSSASFAALWAPVRPAVVAMDPTYAGDEEAFCAAYGANAYAPDLR